jgi:hypothetical protein
MGDETQQDASRDDQSKDLPPSMPLIAGDKQQVDIHKPKPVHNWRELLSEVGVIVIGVLIALTAEQLVESWHMRHKIAEVEEVMTLELRDDDLPQAYVRAAIGYCLRDELRGIRGLLDHERIDRAQLTRMIDGYRPPIRTWDTEGWQSASDSDVATHLGAERRNRWSSAYNIMPRLQELNWAEDAILGDLSGVRHVGAPISEDEADRITHQVARLQALNATMSMDAAGELVSGTEAGIVIPAETRAQLDRELRRSYGSCVITPRPHLSTTTMGALSRRLPNGDFHLE